AAWLNEVPREWEFHTSGGFPGPKPVYRGRAGCGRTVGGDALAVSRRCTYCSVGRLFDAERLGPVGDLCRPGLVVEVGLPNVVGSIVEIVPVPGQCARHLALSPG